MSWEISLLYFFSWNFIWFLQKVPTTVENFRHLTAQVKFHQICPLIDYFCWKYVKFQLKKIWRKYVSWYQRVVHNLKKTLFFVSKMTRICWILIRALKCLKNVHFDWPLLCKLRNVCPKKIQTSYISWHWGAMHNLRKNWLVVWKMTSGIWQIFIRTTESANGIPFSKVENAWATNLQRS